MNVNNRREVVMFASIVLPRPQVGESLWTTIEAEVRGAVAAGSEPVICLAGWPNCRLSATWLDDLTDVIRRCADLTGGRTIVAEVPLYPFEQLRGIRRGDRPGQIGRSTVVRDVLGHRDDPGGQLDPVSANALTRQLNRVVPEWASKLLSIVAVQREARTCYELPAGVHTNANVVLRTLWRKENGDGLLHSMKAALARQLLGRQAMAVVYWGPPGHVTVPTLVEDVHKVMQAQRRRKLALVRLSGEYDAPTITGDDLTRLKKIALDGESVAVVVDIIATGTLVESIFRLLHTQAGFELSSISVGAFVAYSFHQFGPRHGLIYKGNEVPTVVAATVDATAWETDCLGCRDGFRVVPVHAEVRPDRPIIGREDYQPSRASVWSAVLEGGIIGHPGADLANQHLHDRYVVPGERNVGRLMSEIALELRSRNPDAIVCHLPNGTAKAISDSVKDVGDGPHLPVIPARKTASGWVVETSELPRGTRVVVIDDGATTGKSVTSLIGLLMRRRLVPVAAVVFEDKLDPGMRAAIQALLSRGVKGRRKEGSFFSVHSCAPSDALRFDDGGCRRCVELDLISLALQANLSSGVRQQLPRFASDDVWAVGDALAGPGRPILDVSPATSVGEQLATLLSQYDDLMSIDAHLAEIIILDFVPHLREQDLTKQLCLVDGRWRPQVLALLDNRDLDDIAATDSSLLAGMDVPIAVAALRNAGSYAAMNDAIDRIAALEADQPKEVRRWEPGFGRALIRCLSASPSVAAWARSYTADSKDLGSVSRELKKMLDYFAERLTYDTTRIASPTSAWLVAERQVIDRASDEFLEVRDGAGWLLDLKRHQLRRYGAKVKDLLPAETLVWAAALIRGSLSTRDATGIYRTRFPADCERPEQFQRRVHKFYRHIGTLKHDHPDLPLTAPAARGRVRRLYADDVSTVTITWLNDDSMIAAFMKKEVTAITTDSETE